MDIQKIFMVTFGLAVFMILAANVIVPFWNTTGGASVTGTGLTAAAWQGLLLIVVLASIFGLIYSMIKRT